ncbi:MAG: zinc transporter ZupT, partial [Phycisphaerae bacterium SM1_79]
AFFARRTNTKLLSVALGFSAGVMIYVSFVEIFPKAKHSLVGELGEAAGYWATALAKFKKLYRMGLFTALAIAIHNFPEGFATFFSALRDTKLGIAIAIAIAIHNIPEGVAVSIPIFYATDDRKKAFVYSFLSGLAEPAGALIGYAIFFSFFNDLVFGIVFAAVAGIMVFISLDELLPTAREYGQHHLAAYGLVAGMVVMALSLLLLA